MTLEILHGLKSTLTEKHTLTSSDVPTPSSHVAVSHVAVSHVAVSWVWVPTCMVLELVGLSPSHAHGDR